MEATGLTSQFFHAPRLNNEIQKISPAGEKEKSGGGLEIIGTGPIRSPSLLQYLDARCIDHNVAGRFLKEVRYRPREKLAEFYALGWPSGEGFDIRSSAFKGFAGQGKDISRLGLADGKSLSIFEGFFDFLAFLTYYDISDFRNSAIVMNSTALRKRVLEEILLYDFVKSTSSWTTIDLEQNVRIFSKSPVKILRLWINQICIRVTKISMRC